MNTHKKILG